MNTIASTHRLVDKKSRPKKYFRIIDDDIKTSPASLLSGGYQKNYEQLSKSLLKDKQFLYIDINDEKGFKIMKEIEQSDTDEQTQQLGNNYVSSLDYLSDSNSKAVSYLFQRKNYNKKKNQALEMMSEQLKRSRDKLKKYGALSLDKESIYGIEDDHRVHVYRGMDSEMIEKIKLKDEYEELSKILREREDNLLKYYNTIDTHCSKREPEKKKTRRSKELQINTFLPLVGQRNSQKH